MLVTAHRHRDIMSALRLAEEFKIRIVLDGASDAHLILDELKKANIPVILEPAMTRAGGERENASFETAAKLREAGIPFAFQSGFEGYVPKTRVVLFEGRSRRRTASARRPRSAPSPSTPQRSLGIDKRVGSLEVGKDGDVALYDGDPFEYTTHCVGTVIGESWCSKGSGSAAVAGVRGWLACVVVVVAACQAPNQGAASTPTIVHDAKNRQIAISDGTGNLILRLRYEHQCTLDSVRVGGREVVREDTGVCSAVKVGGAWFTTRAGIETPAVDVTNDTVTVTGIRFGGGGASVVESWRFEARAGGIEWTIERECAPGVALEDSYQPGFDFADMSTWTGALLGTGGVAWCRLFDAPNASYGVHTGDATYWRAAERACLRIEAEPGAGQVVATRFSRQPSGVFSANLTISAVEMIPKNGLSRFLHDRQDVWRPFEAPARSSVRLVLSAPSLDEVSARWDFVGIDGAAVRAVRDTIARAGVIDMGIIGSNSYYSDCAVLHEPWIAQMGILIDDPNYLANMARMIDLQRERRSPPTGG